MILLTTTGSIWVHASLFYTHSFPLTITTSTLLLQQNIEVILWTYFSQTIQSVQKSSIGIPDNNQNGFTTYVGNEHAYPLRG